MSWLTAVKKIFILSVCLLPLTALASNIHVNVEVLEPSCTINNGETIEVDFGDEVLSTKLDGNHYHQTFFVNFQCNTSTPNTIFLKIEGEQWESSIKVLKTSKENLNIEFFRAGQWFPLNERLEVNPLSSYAFQAAPYKVGNVKVQAGPFSAAATLAVYYE